MPMLLNDRLGRLLAAVTIPVTLVCVAPAAHADSASFVSQHTTVSISPTSGGAGDPVTITVAIDKPAPASSVNLVFSASEGGAFNAGTCTSSGASPTTCTAAFFGTAVVVSYASNEPLQPGPTTVTINTTVSATTATGTYHLQASPNSSVSAGAPPEFETYSPSTLDFTVTPPAADIAVGLTAGAPPLLASYIDYTATATAQGPGAVSTGTIVTQLPAPTTSVTNLAAGCSYNSANRQVTCATGAIPNGSAVPKTFRAHLGLLTIGLPLNATATRTASTPSDPDPANDSATAGCTVLTGLIIDC
ncbi:hypothetical protein ACIBG8_09865 [Nonomuraea sp. NPDC050556]|uniref:hypothetical protein n=1 Tax=Nonomuraea sp. NPDC050556 TaxID=3364369 RepID=UPI003788C77F